MALKNQREQLMHTVIGQVVIMAMVIIISWMYVIPEYNLLATSITSTNSTITKFNSTTSDGIPYPELSTILSATK
jgi:hypothetical protein